MRESKNGNSRHSKNEENFKQLKKKKKTAYA